MKNKNQLLAILLSVLLVCTSSEAVEISTPKDVHKVKIQEVCISGLAYVVAITGRSEKRVVGVSLVQVFTKGKHGVHDPQPKTCAN